MAAVVLLLLCAAYKLAWISLQRFLKPFGFLKDGEEISLRSESSDLKLILLLEVKTLCYYTSCKSSQRSLTK